MMGVGDEEQMKNKEEEAPRTTMMLSVSNGQRGGGSRPINRTFILAPVQGKNRC